jgi:hypothetical protein
MLAQVEGVKPRLSKSPAQCRALAAVLDFSRRD